MTKVIMIYQGHLKKTHILFQFFLPPDQVNPCKIRGTALRPKHVLFWFYASYTALAISSWQCKSCWFRKWQVIWVVLVLGTLLWDHWCRSKFLPEYMKNESLAEKDLYLFTKQTLSSWSIVISNLPKSSLA